MDIFNLDKLTLFLVFFVPGFISSKIWSLLVASESRKMSDYLFEVVSYSCINFAVLSWLINIVVKLQNSHRVWAYVLTFMILFVFPVIWPILFRIILKCEILKGKIVFPTPKAWDHFFGTGQPCYVLVHLKNGRLIGGLYSGESYASSFPQSEDIYLEQVWKVDKTGCFLEMIESTKGVWLNKECFDYLEFFEVNIEEE